MAETVLAVKDRGPNTALIKDGLSYLLFLLILNYAKKLLVQC